jgi:hypothetical protein
MGLRSAAAVGVLAGLLGCAAHRGTVETPKASKSPLKVMTVLDRSYVDQEFGFELTRPEGNWEIETSGELSPEGVAIPLVMSDSDTGAQVVIQVAPAVATPAQFAARLAAGLRRHEGFTATDPEPVESSENAVGFHFALGTVVLGRVVVLEGGGDRIFMLMATWPASAPSAAARVGEILASVHTLRPR